MDIKLNLARKWRSKNFDQIVGQDLTVRILKNSLYRNHFFPVYLFSGQRGCGKTSTARIFAAAVNCELFEAFQENPQKNSIPCLKCSSCVAMAQAKHPDFIEIDAASHTGVDNVRQIIEAASLLPLLGHKKIYLIDEAHMLSKAAFNAFLKLLEEPPPSVIFILATTEVQKIIDTVKSRCFQLFFKPVSAEDLLPHLQEVCKVEEINSDEEGLSYIIKETYGSIRDALNVLEQVRFSSSKVCKNSVAEVLGHLDDAYIVLLLTKVLQGSTQDVLTFLHEKNISSFSCESVWNRFIDLLRELLLFYYAIDPIQFSEYKKELSVLKKNYPLSRIQESLQLFYNNEALFLKTVMQHRLFEGLLLQLCLKTSSKENLQEVKKENILPTQTITKEAKERETTSSTIPPEWNIFLKEVISLQDPLLHSIFKQAHFLSCDEKNVTVSFAKKFIFFNDMLEQAEKDWKPLLDKAFDASVELKTLFEGESEKQNEPSERVQAIKKKYEVPQHSSQLMKPTPMKKKETLAESILDVSDATLWEKTNMVLQVFPGTVTEIKEETNE